MRRRMLASVGGKTLPYKRQVECIFSDGRSCCVIPHVHSDANRSRTVSSWKMIKGSNLFGKNLFQGAIGDYNWINGTYDKHVYAGAVSIAGSLNSFVSVGDNELELIYEFGLLRSIANGYATQREIYGYLSPAMLAIFSQNEGDYPNPIPGRCPTGCGCRSFKYWDGETMIADLIPVEIVDGVYGFFNLIDKTLLENVVPGSFLLGPNDV